MVCCLFFFNDTATTEIYTLSLHDALPIWRHLARVCQVRREVAERVVAPVVCHPLFDQVAVVQVVVNRQQLDRSEEHTSELQSRQYLVCRLLLEKKNTKIPSTDHATLTIQR